MRDILEDGDDYAAFMDTDEPAAAAARPPRRVSWAPSASFHVTPFVVTDEERQARTKKELRDRDSVRIDSQSQPMAGRAVTSETAAVDTAMAAEGAEGAVAEAAAAPAAQRSRGVKTRAGKKQKLTGNQRDRNDRE